MSGINEERYYNGLPCMISQPLPVNEYLLSRCDRQRVVDLSDAMKGNI